MSDLPFAVLAAFGAMLCWGIGDFLMQRSARVIGNIEALAWIGIIGSVVLFPFVYSELHLLASINGLIILVVLGIITFAAALFDLEALKIGKIAVVDMVISLELPMTILLGMLFMHDVLTIWQFVLILATFWGVSLISVEPKAWRFKIEKGVWLAIAAALGMALVNFFTALGSQQVSPLMAVWVPWVIFTILCLVVMIKRGELPEFAQHAKKHTSLILLMGLFDTFAWIFYANALASAQLSIITAITEGYVVIAFFLGVWINKERVVKHQYAGAAVAFLASIMLALSI